MLPVWEDVRTMEAKCAILFELKTMSESERFAREVRAVLKRLSANDNSKVPEVPNVPAAEDGSSKLAA